MPKIILSLGTLLLEETVYSQSSTSVMEIFASGGSEHDVWEAGAGVLIVLILFYILWCIWSYNQDDAAHDLYLDCDIKPETDYGDGGPTHAYVRDMDVHDATLVTSYPLEEEKVSVSVPGVLDNDEPLILHGHVTNSHPLDHDSWLVDVHFDENEEALTKEALENIIHRQKESSE